jgi:hypothetical protein
MRSVLKVGLALALLASVSAETAINDIFPHIKLKYEPYAIGRILKYGKSQGWTPIGNNTARIVIQPLGFVSKAYLVDLASGTMLYYPGSRSKDAPQTIALTADELSGFRNLIQSGEFRSIPSQNNQIQGCDGASVLIETNIDNQYQWILRWSPEEKLINHVCSYLNDVYTKNR